MHQKTIIALLIATSVIPIGASAATASTVPVTGHAPTAQPTLDNTLLAPGETVTVTSGFADVDGDVEDTTAAGTSFQWWIEDAVGSGTYTNIDGATGSSYTPVLINASKHLMVKVIPRTYTTVTYPAVGTPVMSHTAMITTAPVPFKGITANGTTFTVNDGFPSTGFTQAFFALGVTTGSASDYIWSNGGNTWTTVDNTGKVTFTAKGNSTPVTITATPKAGGAPQAYTFTVGSWFINNGSTMASWSDASAWCTTQGAVQPTKDQVTQGENTRGIGSLWSEWGNMNNYQSSGFVDNFYWTSEAYDSSHHNFVDLTIGFSDNDVNDNTFYSICT
ncbi:hypothetical protein WKA22_004097 [Yersinia enterocolitica]|nr:hypothetical protein [Yersinia enterocolitica]